MKQAHTSYGTFRRHDEGVIDFLAPCGVLDRPPSWTVAGFITVLEQLGFVVTEPGRAMASQSIPHDGTGAIEP